MKRYTNSNSTQDGKTLSQQSNLNNLLYIAPRYRQRRRDDECGSYQLRPRTVNSQLQIWTDRNQDGYASAGERQSLADLGILSIDLDPAHILTGTVAGKANVKVVNALTDDIHKTSLQKIDSTISAYRSSGAIDRVTGSGQTALVVVTNEAIWMEAA